MHFTTYYYFFNVTAFGSHQALQSCLHIFSNGFTLFYLCVCVCLCLCMYAHVCAGAFRGQRRVLDSLELDLLDSVSHPLWMLGSELRFS